MGPTLTYADRPIPQSNPDASVTLNHRQQRACAVDSTFLAQHNLYHRLALTVYQTTDPLRLSAAQLLHSRCDPLNDRGRRAVTSSQCRHPLATARPRYRRNPRRRHREHFIRGARAPTWKMGRAAQSGRASLRDMTQAQRMAQVEGKRRVQEVPSQPSL
jgi:hypothetical protein